MQKITPFLWFDGNAEEAMKFYTSIFKNSKMGQVHRYGEEGVGDDRDISDRGTGIHGAKRRSTI
jgi:predicted 3-demethylubiquinone-9 3-methyltransferase (glyoxalase superfamily)